MRSSLVNTKLLQPACLNALRFSAKDSGSGHKTSIAMHLTPLEKIALAIQQKQKIAEEKLLQEQIRFLNQTFSYVNGEPFSGLDLLKTIDAAIQKRFFKRAWINIGVLTAFTLGTAGTFMTMKSFRDDWAMSLRYGLPRDEFKRLLNGLELKGGGAVDCERTYLQLVKLGLLEETWSRLVLSQNAHNFLKQNLK